MNIHRIALVATMLLLVGGGCDPTVDRFQENDLHYSIFGYLNASADTQFVRVEPLRDSMLTRAPETLKADVTLSNLSTGRTVSLRDSLFRYLDAATAHNFYTTVDVEPATPYRLVVQGPEGAESRVQTTVPDAFPPPTVVIPVPECFPDCPFRDPPECDLAGGAVGSRIAVVSVKNVERLVAVNAHYTMKNPPGVWSFGHLADTVQTAPGVIEGRVDYGQDYCRIPPPVQGSRTLEEIEVVVAAGSPNWPDFLGLDLETELLPGVASNVEGGVGFLGGIVTDTVVVYPHEE